MNFTVLGTSCSVIKISHYMFNPNTYGKLARCRKFHTSAARKEMKISLVSLLDQTKKSIKSLKRRDKVTDDYSLIYKAPMELTLRVAYPCYLACTLGLIGGFAYEELKKSEVELGKKSNLASKVKFYNPQFEFWIFSGALILFVLVGVTVIFKYPFRIYKHNQKKDYIGIFLSPIPGLIRQIKFNRATETFFRNPVLGLMPDSHYILDDKWKVLMMVHLFRVPKDLEDMLKRN